MSATDCAPGSRPTFSDQELEILRLLASGHTVKSIAARLDRTEASINERLRDARRKAGIGSSRELARKLAAQKFWDEKFDLPTRARSNEDDGGSRPTGLFTSKGTRIVLIATPFLAAALALAAASTSGQPAAHPEVGAASPKTSPLIGDWALDVSRIPEAERPRRVTIRFSTTPDGKWSTSVEIVASDGSVRRAGSTAAIDGAPAPVSGDMGSIDTVALRQPAPGTLVMTLGKGGSPVSTRVYTVSRDRKAMTETIVWASGQLPGLETTHFDRIG